mmetsp:Transcript_113962/g.243043  ORF Transcript_113962/g.243043 Transcript_113962/m.243043 type:complete len:152 (+) Transcript_113962:290-745(+)
MAWALDVLREDTLLDRYLPVAIEHFCQVAVHTPQTSGMSWVEIASVTSAHPATPGAGKLAQRFQAEVGGPAFTLLSSLASPRGGTSDLGTCGGHGVAMSALSSYAPRHMVPHLGLPFTRVALGALGVGLWRTGAESPSATLREECWRVGVW